MEKIFEKIGHSLGATFNKGKWLYQSAFGSEKDALQAELKVSRDLVRKLKKEITILIQSDGQKTLERIGSRLCDQFRETDRDFRFYLIASRDVNGFALPGGLVFLTSGLFRKIENNEDEIAFVLAHEMSHIQLRHLMSRILANYSIQTISRLLRPGGTLGALASEIVANLLKSGFSQENEFEADKGAVRLMSRANFDVTASASLLRKLQSENESSPAIHHYFSTHPPVQERIRALTPLIRKKLK
ncbi:MAG: M48 family metalloprotease [Calditrichaeota bacterium]|nr:M48 family metalloprotease [Calditrichota bacterium]